LLKIQISTPVSNRLLSGNDLTTAFDPDDLRLSNCMMSVDIDGDGEIDGA
jgi:hypothetical protein